MLDPNCGATIRPARISSPMLATPETNTASPGPESRSMRARSEDMLAELSAGSG
ncbi:hypothetical protein ACFQL0_17825 [Haloplanus litoreus]